MEKKIIFLSAGGTGGHLFPAEALAHAMKARGWLVHLLSDRRAEKYTGNFPADDIHIIRSATFDSKNPIAIAKTLFELFSGYRQAYKLINKYQPKAIIGFGGYPTVPPLSAAKSASLPIIIQEQNAILGRANKLMSGPAKAIAVGFAQVGASGELAAKTVVTGNPLRPPVREAANEPYQPSLAEDEFNLLIFGGSQGAHFLSQVLPQALALLPKKLRKRLNVVQQARPEDQVEVIAAYQDLDIVAEVSPFFDHMPMRIAKAQLVICRAGASSVAELTAIGRPSILVPLPHSLDGDQAANGADLAGKGGAILVPQADLSAEKLSSMVADAMGDAAGLAKIAATAKLAAMPDASEHLAELVEYVASGGKIEDFKGLARNEIA